MALGPQEVDIDAEGEIPNEHVREQDGPLSLDTGGLLQRPIPTTASTASSKMLKQISKMSSQSSLGDLTRKYTEMWQRTVSGEIGGRQQSTESQRLTMDHSFVADEDWYRQLSLKSIAFREKARTKAEPNVLPMVADFLSGYQASALNHMMLQQAKDHNKSDEEEHGHGHHGARHPSIVSAFISSIINFLLMFGLNCAYGMIMFSETWMQQHQGLGVKICLGASLIVGFGYSIFSGIPCAIAGTDLNPVVLLNSVIIIIAEEIGKEHSLTVPTRRLEAMCGGSFTDFEGLGLGSSGRLLGGGGDGACGSSSVQFCTGTHYTENTLACDMFHEELRATSIFAVSVTSLFMCIIFFTLGRLRLIGYVTYMPSIIMDAFLSCVGYKVFKYGLTFCLDDPRQFVPAAVVGVSLYFAKAYHVGPPAAVIPAMLLIPLVLFYIVILIQYGGDDQSFIDKARDECLFFPTMEDVDFWKIWEDGIFKYDKINFKAWAAAGVDTGIMLVVVLLDCLLKLAGTETKMHLKADKNYECQMVGALNFITACCGSAVGYMQLKFNVINAGILGNTKDRRAGMGYAIWCGVCFFSTIKLFNYMPRFFLGVLLFFAGASFVAENLWGSRKSLSLMEWCQIMLIVAIFIITDMLLYAVLAGIVIVSIDFIRRYAMVPIRKGPPLRGGQASSKERFTAEVNAYVEHMANSLMLVIKLKGFIFFASADSLTQHIEQHFEQQEQDGTPAFRRLQYLVFDCENLDGMDPSAIKAMHKLAIMSRRHHVRLMWTALKADLKRALDLHETLDREDKDQFMFLEEAVGYVQHRILDRAVKVQENWCKVHPTFHLFHAMVCKKYFFGPFQRTLDADGARFGCPWRYCGRLRVNKYKTVIYSPDHSSQQIYLIHSGAVGLFKRLPGHGEEWDPPDRIFRSGAFLNTEVLINSTQKCYAVALQDGDIIFWNRSHWAKMSVERPYMTNALIKSIMLQDSTNMRLLQEELADAYARHEEDTDIFKILNQVDEHETERTAVISQDVQERVASLLAAHKLDAFKFYEGLDLFSDQEGMLPELPGIIRHDLEIAFNTYCEVSSVLKGRNVVKPERCIDALMYAGVFNIMFIHPPDQELTLESFVALGHEAFLMRLSVKNVEAIDYVFKQFDPDNSGFLSFPELAAVMRALFHPFMTTEFITNSLQLWTGGHDVAQRVDKVKFEGFMSRFLRIHEMDWYLLRAFEETIGIVDASASPKAPVGPPLLGLEVLHTLEDESGRDFTATDSEPIQQFLQGGRTISGGKQMTPEETGGPLKELSFNAINTTRTLPEEMKVFADLEIDPAQYTFTTERLKSLDLGLTEDEIEEMFWVANCYGGFDGSGHLDYRLVAPMLLTVFESPDRLPPIPRVPKRFETDKMGELNTKLEGVRTYVCDFRKLRHASVALTEEIEHSTLDDHYVNAVSKSRVSNGPRQIPGAAIVKPALVAFSHNTKYVDPADEYTQHKEGLKKQKIEGTLLSRLRDLLEEPESSPRAQSIWIFRAAMIVLSVLALVLEDIITENEHNYRTDTEKGVWLGWEILFTIWFTLEYCLRVVAWTGDGLHTYLDFLLQPLNVCEFFALLPLYIEIATYAEGGTMKIFRILRLCELARVVRLCRLSVLSTIFPPIAVCLTVVWGIYLKGQI